MNKNIQEIKGEDYLVRYHEDSATATFQGELALGGLKEYAPIRQLLTDIIDDRPSEVTIDLNELHFLNSSGINMLSKFLLGLRKKKEIQMIVVGSNSVPWQGKSLKNLQKCLPTLKLEIR